MRVVIYYFEDEVEDAQHLRKVVDATLEQLGMRNCEFQSIGERK